ncbi:kinase-like domain-containing protein [Rhizophagus irregularis DAOM 181602=DAOM 197198]|nr:kinase-like domain-containing protein [Rhizophagus irregularis DAOM 181602=DAOM 197198]
MNISNQNLDTTEITLRNNSKTDAKNLWKEIDNDDEEYQYHATIFSTDSTTESDETISYLKKVNIMDLEKRKEIYGVCGECNEPEWERISRKVALKSLNNSSNNISNDFLNEIKYYISGHFHASNTVICFGITQDPNTKDYMMVLDYHEGGNLRNTLVKGLDYKIKIRYLFQIIDGLSEPVNSTDYLSSFQETISSSSANSISECLDCELNELDLNQDDNE